MSETRVHGVRPHPNICLLACKLCGVLLWDIDAHFAHAHADVEVGGRDAVDH